MLTTAQMMILHSGRNLFTFVCFLVLGSSMAFAQTPNELTTYIGDYGSTPPEYVGASQLLRARAYNPSGVDGIVYLEVDLKKSLWDADPIFRICVFNFGNGNYSLKIGSDTAEVPWPYLQLTPDGNTRVVNVTNELLQLTSYRLNRTQNELQLDLGLAQAGLFSEQVTLWARTSSDYSRPWMYIAAGQWNVAQSSPLPGSPASSFTAVWANNGEDKVTRDELRSTKHLNVTNNSWNGQQVTIFGATNEVVAFNLVLEVGDRTAKNVAVTLSSLMGPSGYAISSPPARPSGIFTWADNAN